MERVTSLAAAITATMKATPARKRRRPFTTA
jgi:hypothetical protein